MQHSTQPTSLESILATAQEKMQQLLKLLLNETAALQKNNLDELEEITKNKIILTEQIEKNEQQRVHFLTIRGLNSSSPSEWLHSEKLKVLWIEIKSFSEQAQKQNQINGMVINGNRHRVQTQIDILNAAPPSVELVYSASGENIKHRNSNSIAQA